MFDCSDSSALTAATYSPFYRVRIPLLSTNDAGEDPPHLYVNVLLSSFLSDEGEPSLDSFRVSVGNAIAGANDRDEDKPFRLCYQDDENCTIDMICDEHLECALRYPPSRGLKIQARASATNMPAVLFGAQTAAEQQVIESEKLLQMESKFSALLEEKEGEIQAMKEKIVCSERNTNILQSEIHKLRESNLQQNGMEKEGTRAQPPSVAERLSNCSPQQANPYQMAAPEALFVNGRRFEHCDSICALVFRSWNVESVATWDVSHLIPGWYSVTAEYHADFKIASKSVKAGMVQMDKEPTSTNIAEVVRNQLSAAVDAVFDHKLRSNWLGLRNLSLGWFEVSGKQGEHFVVSMAGQDSHLYITSIAMTNITRHDKTSSKAKQVQES